VDPITIAAIGAGAGALGPILGFHGQEMTNRSNETTAKDATSANMADAQRNRDFQASQSSAQMAFQADQIRQEREYATGMSNTSHQRAVEDLKRAGLNPMLAMNSGASTPNTGAASGASGSGAQGSAVTIPKQNSYGHLTGLVNTALEAATALGGLEKQKAETSFIKAQTTKTGVDTETAKKDLPKSQLLNEVNEYVRGILTDAKKYWLPKTAPTNSGRSTIKFNRP